MSSNARRAMELAVVVLALACTDGNEAASGDGTPLDQSASPPTESGPADGTGPDDTDTDDPTSSSSTGDTNGENAPAATTGAPEENAQPTPSVEGNEPAVEGADGMGAEPEAADGMGAEPEAADGMGAEPEAADGQGPETPVPASTVADDEASPAPSMADATAPSEPVEANPSEGCSAGANPPVGAQTLDVAGTARSYIVSLPEDYDPTQPYPLVFAFHGLGGSAELVSGRFYFGLEEPAGRPTVFVYPDGLDTGDGAGWANTDGQDVAFFDALFATLQQTYCIDSARVFSTGHSYGGIMTHTLACQRASVLRAIAPVAGAFFGGRGGECSGPVAAWGAHGNPDNTVEYESGLSAIERVMETNGCDPESGTPVEPTEFCVRYECDSDYPVTWCAHDQDHDWPEFAAESIRGFFDSF